MPAARILLLVAVLALAGCGDDDSPGAFPPAAEPARSPAPAATPAGRTVDLGARAEGVAVDARTGLVAVATQAPDELVLVDARTLEVRRRVALPGPAEHVTLRRPGGPALVPIPGGLVEVALRTGETTIVPLGGAPLDVAATEDGLAATDELGYDVAVVRDGRLARREPAGLQTDGIAALDDGRFAVVAARERTLTVGEVSEPAGIGPTHVEAADDGRLYVADTTGGSVLLFRSEPELGLARRAAVAGSPYGTAIDRERGKLWVTTTATNEAVQLTADGSPRIQRRYPTVRQPNSIAVDERTGRVYVASAADGTLQAFDGYPPTLAGR